MVERPEGAHLSWRAVNTNLHTIPGHDLGGDLQ